VLGPVEVWRAGAVVPVGSGRARLVLAMLLLNADRLVPIDRLVDAVWGDPPSSARAQLYNIISNLRRRLEPRGLIVTQPLGYQLRLGSHQLDLRQFRQLIECGQELAAAGDHERASAVLSDAAALWRGPALANVSSVLADGLRQALHEERLSAASARLDAELALGRYDVVLRLSAGLLADHPYRERLYEMQMVALVGAGRRADALATYRRVYRRFVAELGVEPGPALCQLEQRILEGEALTPERLTAPVAPRELPPVAAMLTGRDKLTDAVSDALCSSGDGGPAVAVLTGPGGVGKTAVAIACAHGLAEAFPTGSCMRICAAVTSDQRIRTTWWAGSCARWGSTGRACRMILMSGSRCTAAGWRVAALW
jgi:DNA-binding SARP family transcriptional activator